MAATVTAESDLETTEASVPAPPKKSRAKNVFLGAIVLAIAGGGTTWARGRGHESTDDAQVEGHLINVASRVSGRVAKVLVTDNQLVEAGTPIVELEDDVQKAKVDLARADVASAKAQLASAKAQLSLTEKNAGANLEQAKGGITQASSTLASTAASVSSAKAEITASETRVKLAKTELDRIRGLFEKGAATQAQLDTAQAAHDQAEASLETAKARLAASQASVSASAGGVQAAKGKLDAASAVDEQIALAKAAVDLATAKASQAEANLKLAELDLSFTQIKAPARGVVSRKSVEVGQMVDPSRPLLAIVPKDDVWIVANFKEDQIGEMKVGAKAMVKIDAYPGRELSAHVDSLAGASGARFALLPPDNASGNFTKVVQRVPVLVRIDAAPGIELKPGMSAYVTVNVK